MKIAYVVGAGASAEIGMPIGKDLKKQISVLFGYINNEDIPTCNQRMLHSMQWLGFGKL